MMSIYSAWMVEANFFGPYINGAPRKAAQAPDMVNLHGPCSCAIPSVQDSRDWRNELRKKNSGGKTKTPWHQSISMDMVVVWCHYYMLLPSGKLT
jgi:hypothetical protein